MVAITVILAAVIGTFVLGLGDSLSDNTPQAQLNVENVNYGSNVTISHRGGDELQGEDLNITIDGSAIPDGEFPSSFAVGQETTIEDGTVADGVTLRIIHVPSESIIFERTL